MKRNFLKLGFLLVLLMPLVATAQKLLYTETTKYLPYIPKPGYENKQMRYDKAGRLILSFLATDSIHVEATIYDLDPVGNITKKIHVVMQDDEPKKYRYYVYNFEYITYVYDANNRLTSRRVHSPTEELFAEAIQKIADRLDQK